MTQNFISYYEWGDLLIYLFVMGVLLYWLFATLVVPTRDFLVDHIIAQTTIVQKSSHLTPKWHILNDSVAEMVTVGKDTITNRLKMRDTAFIGFKQCSKTGLTWLCCRKSIASPGLFCCCLCRSRGTLGKK